MNSAPVSIRLENGIAICCGYKQQNAWWQYNMQAYNMQACTINMWNYAWLYTILL